MDPLSAMFAGMQGQMGNMAAGAASMTPSVGGAGADPMSQLKNIMAGIKAPEATKPQFSGGVSGVGMPFLQQMPNLLAPALNASAQRTASVPGLPSLGQLLAGGR